MDDGLTVVAREHATFEHKIDTVIVIIYFIYLLCHIYPGEKLGKKRFHPEIPSNTSAQYGGWGRNRRRLQEQSSYQAVFKPTMVYGAECWAMRKKEEHLVNKTRMLRWIHGISLKDNTVIHVMNGHHRDQAKVSVRCRWPLIRGNLTLKCVGRGIDNVAVQGRWPLTTGVAQGRYYCNYMSDAIRKRANKANCSTCYQTATVAGYTKKRPWGYITSKIGAREGYTWI